MTKARRHRELASISYSRYRRLQECPRKGVVSIDSARTTEYQSSRALLVGNVFHSIAERLGATEPNVIRTSRELREAFNNNLDIVQKELASSTANRHLGSPRDWNEAGIAFRGLRQLLRSIDEREIERRPKLRCEVELWSKDRELVGTIDAYQQSTDSIELIDYKTGLSANASEFSPHHEAQLHLYAYLINENEGRFPDRMSLIGIDAHRVDVPLSVDRAQQLADDMREARRSYNCAVAGSDQWPPGTPSVDACKYCSRMNGCQEFAASLSRLELPDWHHVVIGRQTSPLEFTESGIATLEIEIESSSLGVGVLKIHRIYPSRFANFDDRPGQRLVVNRLVSVSHGDSRIAQATDSTSISKVPESVE